MVGEMHTRRRVPVGLRILAIAVVLAMLFVPLGSALAEGDSNPGFDAVFVMDVSYSMNATDRDRIAAEVTKMFMDMSEAARTQVGFVAYNHKIVEAQPLAPLTQEEQKSLLKKKIAELRFSGYTDLGLGLSKGSELVGSGKGGGRPFMILLSDGGTDFGPIFTGRSVEDSNKDVERVIAEAQAKGYPIYTVGLNHDGSVNAPQLEAIASKTGGTSFITESAGDLPEIFNNIFAKQIRSVLVPVAAVTATGELQEVTVNIPNGSMNEANIVLLSEHPIAETHLYYNSKNIRFVKSDKYSLLKIPQPQKGAFLLKFKARPGDFVKISLLGNYGLKAGMELAQPVKGVPSTVSAFLLHQADGAKLADADVYQSMKAELIVKDLKTNKEERTPMKLNGNGFETQTVFPHSGKYQARIFMSSPDFYRETAVSELDIANTAPEAIGSGAIELTKEDGDAKIDLKNYFRDVNQDKLSYTIASNSNAKLADFAVDGDTLTVSSMHAGKAVLTMTVTDDEGASVTSDLVINVYSVVQRYLIIAGIVLAVLLAAWAVYWLLRPKPRFAGRLEGYFLNTASGSDIPVKYWPLASFEKRQITLRELFASLDVNEPLPEAQHIIIEAGKNGTIVLRHNTRCTIEKGRTPIPRNKKESISYNDKIYITFEDHLTEIELRYKEVKPNAL
ncbi:VWA domain-containing protein [Paenibacillus elgii]|uniref:VWA domain-containing protein n=1 Tax=Paenibacillus elgii TaxID=189691 RepID=A0A2T6G5H1_9BACL|nr:VWA domain-containing protein [Paenibacillus elgii]PUA39416.1 VWA domain-containing protein [Paenibacillus elgii]